MFWVPQAGDLCLGVSLLSYGGAVQVGVNADRGALAAPEDLLNAILQEFEVYRQLAGVPKAAWQQAAAD
jgi:diacylglycerol O-acyltransferase